MSLLVMERAFGSDEVDNAAMERDLGLAAALAARSVAAAQAGKVKQYVRPADWHKVPKEDLYKYEVLRGICPSESVCIGSVVVVGKNKAKRGTIFISGYFGEAPEGAFKLMYDDDQVRSVRMIGKKIGDTVRLNLGFGEKDYKILSIENK